MTQTKEVLATADVGRVIDRTPATVRDLTRRGVLVPVAITPRGVRLYARPDIEAYLEQRAQRRGHAA